jgi:uncharacterized protein involved in exopolysaccharide biosynthesis
MNFLQILKILWARRWIMLATALTCVLVATIVVTFIPRQYRATAQFLFGTDRGDDVTGRRLDRATIGPFTRTQFELIRSDRVTQQVVERLQLSANPSFIEAHDQSGSNKPLDRWIAERLSQNIEVKAVQGSTIVEVSFTSPEPSYTAQVANAVVDVYQEVSLQIQASGRREEAEWYDVQLRAAQEALQQAEAAELTFRSANGLSPDGDGLTIERERLATLASQATAVAPVMVAPSVSAMSRSSVAAATSSLRSQLVGLETQMAQVAERLGPSHPTMQALERNREAIQRQIAQEEGLARSADAAAMAAANAGVMAQAAAASAQQSAVVRAYEAQRQRIEQLSSKMEELAVLTRDVEAKRRVVEGLTERANLIRLQTAAPNTLVMPLRRAETPQTHSFPQRGLSTGIAAAFGVMLGLLFSLLAEMMDRRVRGHEDIEHASNAPVLAIMPGPSNGIVALWRRVSALGKASVARSLPATQPGPDRLLGQGAQ